MAYKLIACDMDETLLNDHHQICQRNIDAIRRAKEEFGVKFVPATGRGFPSIQENLKTLGLYDSAGEYVLSYNGCALSENKGNTILQFKGLAYSKMRELFEFGASEKVCMHVYTQDMVYIYNITPEDSSRIKAQKLKCEVMKENTVDFLADEPIAKILYQNLDGAYLRSLEAPLKPITDNHCDISYSSNRYMEFNALGVNKGQGLIDLAKLLNIDISETIAVGDNFNDLTMLKVAGLSVAAQNAVQPIKDICDYTTTANNNEGVVAELLEKFVFNV